jgi:hypothetical protein
LSAGNEQFKINTSRIHSNYSFNQVLSIASGHFRPKGPSQMEMVECFKDRIESKLAKISIFSIYFHDALKNITRKLKAIAQTDDFIPTIAQDDSAGKGTAIEMRIKQWLDVANMDLR